MLLKLFRTALQYEVKQKIASVRDFVTGNPTVVRLVMARTRASEGGYLAKVLGPFVQNLLKQDEIDLELNPVEVYKTWVSKQEASSGQKSSLPYEVSREVALQHEAVRQAVDMQTTKVLELCNSVLVSS